MFENKSTENLKKEINDLVEHVKKVQDNIDLYCELMKKMILNSSNLN